MRTLFCVIAAALPLYAQAQMYKCIDQTGKVTFSQTQCAGQNIQNLSPPPQAAPIQRRVSAAYSPELDFLKLWTDEVKRVGYAETSASTQEDANKCLSDLKNKSDYFDPESVRIENSPITSILKNGKKEVTLMVNAKNRYGGYVGAKSKTCYYDANGKLEMIIDL